MKSDCVKLRNYIGRQRTIYFGLQACPGLFLFSWLVWLWLKQDLNPTQIIIIFILMYFCSHYLSVVAMDCLILAKKMRRRRLHTRHNALLLDAIGQVGGNTPAHIRTALLFAVLPIKISCYNLVVYQQLLLMAILFLVLIVLDSAVRRLLLRLNIRLLIR